MLRARKHVILMSQSEANFHRESAKKCFNQAWDYLDKKERDAKDEQEMLHLAHASRYHWSLVGDPRKLAVGDWQISRIYAALNEPHLALRFAKSTLENCQKNKLSELLPSAYEGMARAYTVAKDYQSARNYVNKAREQLASSTGLDDEDKKIYSDQIRETEELIDD
jgi:tetratricopeptide (TPR) repeat protein